MKTAISVRKESKCFVRKATGRGRKVRRCGIALFLVRYWNLTRLSGFRFLTTLDRGNCWRKGVCGVSRVTFAFRSSGGIYSSSFRLFVLYCHAVCHFLDAIDLGPSIGLSSHDFSHHKTNTSSSRQHTDNPQLEKEVAKAIKRCQAARHLVLTLSQLRCMPLEAPNRSNVQQTYLAPCGLKERYHRHSRTPLPSGSESVKETETSVITTMAYPCSPSLARSLPASCSVASMHTLSATWSPGASVVSVQDWRSTLDMVLAARQLQGKCREQNVCLYTTFIDPSRSILCFARVRGLSWRTSVPPPL